MKYCHLNLLTKELAQTNKIKAMKKEFLITMALMTSIVRFVSSQITDTVVVALAPTSKMILTVGDREDLDQLRTLDYQALFDDIIDKLDTSYVYGGPDPLNAIADEDDEDGTEVISAEDHSDPWAQERDKRDGCIPGKTHQSFNFDFGINSFLEEGRFPDENGAQYTVRPWGSWCLGINSVQRTDLGRNFYIEWGLGVSWYNFKFQDDETWVLEGEDGVEFLKDPRDLSFEKSKLSVTYVNASLVPMFDADGHHHHNRLWDSHDDSFRIGVGPYVGYRLESHTRQVYKIEGDRESERERDNFYLNNLRYGLRLQLGIDGADFFFSYDFNDLFSSGKGPQLNAFAFGVIF